MVFLAKLESAFTVPGRGCVVVPAAVANPDLRIKAGDVVQLRGANGCPDAHIVAVEWLVRRDNGCHFGFLLSGTFDCSQIGLDTEIWVADRLAGEAPTMARVDYIEVGRTAHELHHRHGRNAHEFASRLAAEALADGKDEEYEFWRAVELHVTPREG